MKILTIKIKRTLMFMLHWRIGLTASIFLLWLAVTGLLLNHSRDLGLHSINLDAPVILSAYDMNLPDDYIRDIERQDHRILVKTADGVLALKPEEDPEEAVARHYRGEGINLEKLILDLHTGKLFGAPGTLITDLAAIALIFLTLSGLYNLWRRKKG